MALRRRRRQCAFADTCNPRCMYVCMYADSGSVYRNACRMTLTFASPFLAFFHCNTHHVYRSFYSFVHGAQHSSMLLYMYVNVVLEIYKLYQNDLLLVSRLLSERRSPCFLVSLASVVPSRRLLLPSKTRSTKTFFRRSAPTIPCHAIPLSTIPLLLS